MRRVLLALAAASLCACLPDTSSQVAAFGDSVTWGYGGAPGGWVSELERETGIPIANLGVPGETAATGARRIDGPLGLDATPFARVVLVLEGGNDTVHFLHASPCNDNCDPSLVAAKFESMRTDLRRIRSAAAKDHRRVVFGQYWPGSPVACAHEFPGAEFAHFQSFFAYTNQVLTEVAAENGDPVVQLDDLVTLANDPANYYNCLHPSAKGYAIIAARWKADVAIWAPPDDGTWDSR